MIWLVFYQPWYSIGYEKMNSSAIVDNIDLYINDEPMPGTITDRSLLEGFLVERILSGQPMILRVDQLPGWEQMPNDTRSIEQIF